MLNLWKTLYDYYGLRGSNFEKFASLGYNLGIQIAESCKTPKDRKKSFNKNVKILCSLIKKST